MSDDVRRETEDRFWSSVLMVENCWEWLGATTANGYPRFSAGGRTMVAHRYAYELLRGPIPEGMTLDHLCRNRGCVNPDHMEPVTLYENIMRGFGLCAENARKTHCDAGHPLVGTYQKRGHTYRYCPICRTEKDRLAWIRKRSRRNEVAAKEGQ